MRDALNSLKHPRALEPAAVPQVSPRSERRDIETEINQAIGRRIRALRLARGLSQEACSSRLGISFQQLQKYEKGQNRISACSLYRLAGILEVPPSSLLDKLDDGPKVLRRNRISRGMIEASSRLASISDATARRAITDLISALSATDGIDDDADTDMDADASAMH
ncbi:hypothetical protein GCM10011505_13600 [Tistrella bauzanensis]|uniref:HTH cro/C1-type domain-containing protein n=1 Tax=Tistrella bauzanensis TaxID=657419 RepID=A0ABQ1IDR8_9PROT|nr:helix-turn-helix transcriptional regulator [Tistrella bauzanensis]GGB33392.1 hypothetical protein GCM10011505_13600 [Tistrella bauzanensis]